MRIAYADTSALVSVLLDEPGSEDVMSALSAADAVYAANLVEAELCSVLHREKAEPGDLEPLSCRIEWLFPDRSLRDEFVRILGHGYVRGADLWHLACALYMGETIAPPVLVTCDKKQKEVALALGLEVLP